MGYTCSDLGQAILTCMQGAAERWALQQITVYEENSYPEWDNMMVGINENAITTIRLKNLINRQFTCGDHPKYMLKQLQECKQGTKDMEDFLVEFKNLKLLAGISGDHAMEILQSNVPWDIMKMFVQLYGPLAGYKGLKDNL